MGGRKQQWVVWRGPEGPAAEAPLFRQVGGLPASLAELTERAQVYMVSHDRIAPPCGWPALLRPPLALSQWVRLVDLDPLLAVMDQAPRDQPPVGVLAEQAVPGGVLWASEVATPRIDVLLERRVVAQLSPPPGLAIEGAVSGDGVRPRADGRGLVDDAAAAALQERLRGWADGLVEALSRQLPEGDRAAAVLRRALVAKLSEPRGLAALRERKDPLLRVDLFFDSEGRVGTLSDVLAGGEVGVVDADLRGAPDDGRWWRLSGPLREALARHRKVVDQTHRLRALLEGRKRRSVPFRRPEAPPRAVEGETGGVHWALWAGSTYAAEDGIEVLVGGARVQTLDLGGLGLTGFVDGELETDLAFREAVLPRPLRQALETGAVDALAQELAERPAQWMGRMGFARRHGVRLAAGPAGRVVVAASAKGRDVTVAALVKKPGRFRWAEEGVPFAGSAAQVLVGPGERRRWIAHGLGIPLPEVDPPSPEPTDVGPVVATARKLATDARRKELVKVAKEAPEALIRASEDDEATRLLVAWGVASRADSDDDEWALLDRLVRELTGVFGRS